MQQNKLASVWDIAKKKSGYYAVEWRDRISVDWFGFGPVFDLLQILDTVTKSERLIL